MFTSTIDALEQREYEQGTEQLEGLFDAHQSPTAARRPMTLPDTIFCADQSAIADGFVAGNFLHRRRGCVSLPVRVWFGSPPDMDGGVLDRAPRWMIEVAGEVLDDERANAPMAGFWEVWPRCLDNPVPASEIAYRKARIEHAREHDPHDPFGDRFGRIDLLSATPTF